MSIFFIADLHLGHKNIVNYTGEFRGQCKTPDEHDDWIVYQWNSVVRKTDLVWVLGDVAFTKEGLKNLKRMNGTKHLILGNHDLFPLRQYYEYFHKIHGFMKYKGYWLSHAPINTGSLRGLKNIHGHLHTGKIDDSNYICVSVEHLNGMPLALYEIDKPS